MFSQKLSQNSVPGFSQFFTDLKEKYTNISEFIHLFENYEISKLDINRIFRYLEKSITDTKKDDEFLENCDEDCEIYGCDDE